MIRRCLSLSLLLRRPNKYTAKIQCRAYSKINLEKDERYERLAKAVMNVSRTNCPENVFLIQPYIQSANENIDTQLQEAGALVRSISNWKVQHRMKIGISQFDKTTLFDAKQLQHLRDIQLSHHQRITSVFVSKSTITYAQRNSLAKLFKLPVMDRYSMVIQILREHATSRISRLQVALAETFYIKQHLNEASRLSAFQMNLLNGREKQIKAEIEEIRAQRLSNRKRRMGLQTPVIALVGYTNAGKTSLIKALTEEAAIRPRNQLFATLDVTAHAGTLPSNLEVLFMDTIGFIADIPNELLECFMSTLEDALDADLLIHVQDLSHPNSFVHRKHVEETLSNLLRRNDAKKAHLLDTIITVGNKCDLVDDLETAKKTMGKYSSTVALVSAREGLGIDELLEQIDQKILECTGRKKLIVRVPMGGEELQWLHRNATVAETTDDPNNSEYILVHVVITDVTLTMFKNQFLTKTN